MWMIDKIADNNSYVLIKSNGLFNVFVFIFKFAQKSFIDILTNTRYSWDSLQHGQNNAVGILPDTRTCRDACRGR